MRERGLRSVSGTGKAVPVLNRSTFLPRIKLNVRGFFDLNPQPNIVLQRKRLAISVGKITAFGAILCTGVWAQYALAQEPAPPAPPLGAAAPPPDASEPPPPPGVAGAPPLPPGAAGAPPPAITGSNVNLRPGPGTTYTVITLIPAGSPVGVSGCQSGWCQVSFQGQNGYIIASALCPPPAPGGPLPGAVAGGPVPVCAAGALITK